VGMLNPCSAPPALSVEAIATGAALPTRADSPCDRPITRSISGCHGSAYRQLFEIEAYNRMVPDDIAREGVRAFNESANRRSMGR